MVDTKLGTTVVVGALSGAGIDEILRRAAIAYPDLQQRVKIPLPGYPATGVPYDDLIEYLLALGIAGYGYAKKDSNIMLFGASAFIAEYMMSITTGMGTTTTAVVYATPCSTCGDSLVIID